MDPFHQRITDLPEDHDLLQIISTDGDISNLTGDLRAVSDGNSHIGCRKSRGIVDAIADHDDFPAFGFFFLHKACFVFRQDFRMIFVHTHLCRNGFCRTVTVSGHHDDLLKSCLLQIFYHLTGLRTQGIFDTDHSGQSALNGKIQV